MSHPKTVDKFIPWSKAMVAGATVDKPNYGKGAKRARKMRVKRHRRRKRKANGSKE